MGYGDSVVIVDVCLASIRICFYPQDSCLKVENKKRSWTRCCMLIIPVMVKKKEAGRSLGLSGQPTYYIHVEFQGTDRSFLKGVGGMLHLKE